MEEVNYSSIPKGSAKVHYTRQSVGKRLEWARTVSGAALKNIAAATIEPQSLAGNIENYIGMVQVPIGLAGPVHVKGRYVDSMVPVPIATTEGALISSITRGAMVTRLSGGVKTFVHKQTMMRAPVFFFSNFESAICFENWVEDNFELIKEKAQKVSSIANLKSITSMVIADTVHLQFRFTTGDASGQNMTSACTWIACEWIDKQLKNMDHVAYRYYICLLYTSRCV